MFLVPFGIIYTYSPKYRSADKSLARPGRKQERWAEEWIDLALVNVVMDLQVP